MQDYLAQLNPQQRDAVVYLDSPQLVIAGAGSGKTRVLTYKIVHLLGHGFEPWRIMALTFTNKAAKEMRERIESLVGGDTARRLWMGTFHSIFARLLRTYADRIGYPNTFTIYDQADSRSLIKTIIQDLQLDEKVYKPATIQSAISMAKNALISPARYMMDADLMRHDKNASRPATAEIYGIYCKRCKVAGAMDFDDLLYHTNVLLRDNPDVLHHLQEFFRYVLVDEYQDTNFAQHNIVSMLCSQSNNLTMVGDDAQSIYSFRGANIKNILNLRKAYPNLRIFKLEQNYRSTKNIVAAANSLIEKNRDQIKKEIFSENEPGPRIEVINSSTDFEEAYIVANRIARLQRESLDSLEEFAVLYRTNAQSRRLEEALRKRNISYRIYGGLSFYQRKEVKDAIAYFRMSVNPDDDEALRRIINYPARGIGDTTVRKLTAAAIEGGTSIWRVICDPDSYDLNLNKGTLNKLAGFRSIIEPFLKLNAEGADAYRMATSIFTATGILSSLITDKTPESISKQENLQEILTNVHDFVDEHNEAGETDRTDMASFLAEVSLATDQDQNDTSEERVTLMTVHASKGLEFNNIIVVGVEEELFPSSMASDSIADIEEERRLLYVAITRARHFCMLSYASSRFRNGQTKLCQPSRFIHDIGPKFLHMVQGTTIGPQYGGINPFDAYRSSFHTQSAPAATPSQRSHPFLHTTNGTSPAMAQTSVKMPASGDFSVHSLDELEEGMQIIHERFGKGKIVTLHNDESAPKITVLFSSVQQRTLMLKYARFAILP